MDKKELTYELRIKAIIEEAQKNLGTFEKQLKDTWENGAPPKSMSKSLEHIRARLVSLQDIAKKGTVNRSDLAMAENDYKAFSKTIHDLQIEFKLLTVEQKRAMLGEEEQRAMAARTAAIKAYNQELQKNRDILEKRKTIEDQKTALQQKQQPARRSAEATVEVYGKHKDALTKNGPNLSPAAKEYAATLKEQAKLLDEIKIKQAAIENLKKAGRRTDRENSLTLTIKELEKLENQYKEFESMAGKSEYDKAMAQYTKELEAATNAIETAKAEIASMDEEVEVFDKQLGKLKVLDTKKALSDLKKELKALGVDGIDGAETIEELEEAVEKLNGKALQSVDDKLNKLGRELENLEKQGKEAKKGLDQTTEALKQQEQAVASTEAFAAKIKQFVGLAGAAQILSKALRSSFEATKELDAVMTEMSVVTDLRVGDYWKQLPEHTNRANELGVAIKEVYEAETLYYQQGLKTNEVTAMSTETLKMARIAGLSAEDATNKMTAALRGFNMELNETSAKNVADVYSELAAITASDVKEISSAMTKTASIASSAGMEFETTAAFLSQIIETTRESAETAGTAMKTVIARFQELKKDPAEIGEVDGEIVDANKIETALRSVGVALRDSSGQFRDLDDVFLELSSKWDSLDTNTQRYIATIAAGSRQQSRFIAMMSDYNRTQELVNAANTSAGASNKQYEKTLDSLQSKLERLKNAWVSFTQGIANSKLIKAGVDILTKLLTTVNKITDAFGEFSGAAKITLLIAALYLGDKAIKVFMTSLKDTNSIFGAMGAVATKTFGAIKQDLHNAKVAMDQFAATASMAKQKVSTVFTPEQTNAMGEYNKALKDLAESEKLVSQIESQYTQDSDEYRYAMFQKSTVTEQFNQANARIARQLNFTEKEQKDYENLVRAGIATDTAAIAVKNEKVMAVLREKGALNEYNEVLDETILKQNLENMTDKADSMGDFSKKIGDLGGKLQKLKASDISGWFKGLGQNITKLGKGIWNVIKLIGSFIKAFAGAIAMVAVAIVAIIGLIHYIKMLQKTSPEGKLKSAQEAAERAAEAADRASEAYKDLADSLESLDDKYKGLEELTKGTQEWKKAVQEINSEVLDLIDKYPELSRFYTNVDGVLQVKEGKEEEVQKVLDNAALRSAQAQSMDLTAKQNVLKAENDVAYKKLSDEAKYGGQDLERWALIGGTVAGAAGGAVGGGFGGAAVGSAGGPMGTAIGSAVGTVAGVIAGGILGGVSAHAGISALQEDNKKTDKEYTEIIAKAAAEGKFNPANTEEVTKFLQEEFKIAEGPAEHWAEQLTSASGELVEFGNALRQADEQTRMYNEAQAAAALGSLNLASYGETDQSYLQQAASADAYAIQKAMAEQDVEVQFKDKDEAKAIKEEVAKSMYGETAKVKGNKIVYEEDGEEKEVELSKEEFKAHYAAMQATENMADALKEVPNIVRQVSRSLGGISAEAANAYRQAMQNPEKLTNSQTAALSAVSKKDLTNIFNSLTAEQQKYYGDLEGFISQWNEKLDESKKKFENANKLMDQFGNNIGKLNDKFTGDNAVTYTKRLQEMNTVLEGNDEKIAQVNSSINSIAQSLTADEFNSFMSLWNSFDQSDLGAWEDFEEQLTEMGLDAILNTEAFKSMSEATKELRGAIHKVDLNTLDDELSKLYKASKEISEKGSRKVDKETYEMLIKIDDTLATNFVRLGDEFHYLGGSINDLTSVLSKGIMTELQRAKKQVNEQKALYDVVQATNNEIVGSREVNEKQDYDEWFHINAKNLDESGGFGLTDAMVKEYYHFGPGREAYVHDGKINVPYKTGVKKQGVDVWNRKDIEITPELAEKIRANAYEEFKEYYNTETAIEGYSDYYKPTTYEISANGQGNIESLTPEEAKNYIRHFFENAGEAILNNEDLSSAFISHVGDPNAIFGKDVEAMSDEVATELATNIYNFAKNLNLEDIEREEARIEREQKTALMSTNSASVNQDYIVKADLQTEEGKETAVRAYKALQVQAQEAGVMSEEQSGRWHELVTKFENGELTEAETNELKKLREDTVDHLTLIEHQQKGMAAIAQMEQRVMDALVSQKQKEIDKLSAINDSINDANAAMINKIQEQIDTARQEREMEKTEQSIADDQSQLAYLMADTSGGNTLAAQSLQKEITEKQENYQDSLIDQGLQKLSDDNAAAAEQRERQIALMEAQLDHERESGILAREAEMITQDSLQAINEGTSPLDTRMGELISEEENWGNQTVAAQEGLKAEFITSSTEAASGITRVKTAVDNTNESVDDLSTAPGLNNENINAATGAIREILEKEYGKYTAPETDSSGKTVSQGGFVSGGGNQQARQAALSEAVSAATSSSAEEYDNVAGATLTNSKEYQDAWNKYKSANGDMTESQFYDAVMEEAKKKYDWYGVDPSQVKASGLNDATGKLFDLKIGDYKDTDMVLGTKRTDNDRLSELYKETIGQGVAKGSVLFDRADETLLIYSGSAWYHAINDDKKDPKPHTLVARAKAIVPTKFKTGGLADFTGPAWLDGTKSHPELVLNARDTANFIQLKDILAEVMNSTSSISDNQASGNKGDNYFNIDINVEELKDDYDVEQLANKIRSMLYEDATYRNVNAVSYIR